MIPAIIMLGIFLLSNMPSPIYPLWQADIGYSTATITLLFSLYQGGVLLGLLGLGKLADRIGWRVSLISATCLSLLVSILFASAESSSQLMLGRFLSGIAAGIYVSCGPAAVTAVLEKDGHAKPAFIASIAISIGLAFGPLLAGIFADFLPHPTSTVFLCEAILLAVGALLLMRDPRLKAASDTQRTANQKKVDVQQHSAPTQGSKTFFFVVTLIFASCYITSAIYMSIGSSYLQKSLGVESSTLAGFLVFLVFGSAFFAQFLTQKLNTYTQAVIALSAGGIGAIILVLGTTFDATIAVFISAMLSGASQGLGQLVGLTLVRKITPLPKLRGAYAILNTVGYGTSGGAIAASWPLYDMIGTVQTINVVAITVVVLTLVSAFLTVKFKKRMI